MRGGARERPRLVLPRFPPPGREVKASGGWGGGGWGAQPPPPRPGAQRSSLLPTARLERRRRQQASLKEKEMIVSLACPRGRPQPGPWSQPRCLPRTPRPSPDTRSWPSASAPCALTGPWGPPCRARPGAPAAPAHPSSPPGLIPGPLPAAPPRTHSSPPAACKASERSPSRDGAPTKMPGAPGYPGEKLCRLAVGVGPGAPLLGPTVATSFWLFPVGKLSQACFGGRRGRGHSNFTDFGTVPVSSPRVSPPWLPDRAPHPRLRRVPRRERGGGGREKKPRPPLPIPRRGAPWTGGSRLGGSSGRRGLIIDWVTGVAEAREGFGRCAPPGRRRLVGLRWRPGDAGSLTPVVRARVGWDSRGRPSSGGGGGAPARAWEARAAAHRCAAGSIASPWASS
nr:uncharacterized protein LOC110545701 isoform X1 [Meriones unguiculatus]